MSKLEKPTLYTEFKNELMYEIQNLTRLRVKKFTQKQISELLGVSLRTIQLFESYKSESSYVMFGYKRVLTLIEK